MAETIDAAVLEFRVQGDQAISSLGRIEQSAERMETTAKRATGRMADAIAGLGKDAGQSAATLDAASKRFISSLEREANQLSMTRGEYRRWQAEAKGIASTVYEPLIAKIEAAEAAQRKLSQGSAGVAAGIGNLAAELGRVQSLLGGAGLSVGIAAFAQLSRELLDTKARAEALRTTLNFATGGNAGEELEFIRRTTASLGLQFETTASSYAKFAAAARETSLEGGAARKVFEAVAQASAVMGLSAEESQGALLALSQMISKGVVSAEELRGQLGERLPGSFQIAARAMGVTTGELGKLLEQGLVPASEFLPKFAEQLRTELAGSVAAAAETTTSAINRLTNAWADLKRVQAEGAAGDILKGGTAGLAGGIEAAAAAMQRARQEGGGLYAQIAAAQGAMVGFAAGAEDVSQRLKSAEDELARLQSKFDSKGGFYLGAEVAQARELVAELKAAQRERDALAAPKASQDGGFSSASTAIRNIANQGLADEARAAKLLADIRSQALGVNDQWLKQLMALNAERQKGLISEAQYIDAAQTLTGATFKLAEAQKKTAEDAKRQVDAGVQLARSMELQAAGISGGFLDDWAKLNAAYRAGALSLDQVTEAQRKLLEAQPFATAAMRSALDAANALADARRKEAAGIDAYLASQREAAAKTLDSVESRVAAMEAERAAQDLARASNVTLAEAIEMVTLARLREQLANTADGSGRAAELEAEIAARTKLLGLMRDKEVRTANQQAVRDLEREWLSIYDTIGTGLADALMRGGDSAAEYLKRLFSRLVLQPVISSVVSPFAASVASLVTGYGGGSAASPYGSAVNNASNLYSLYGAAGGTIWSSSAAYGAAIGTANVGAGSQAAMLAAQTGEFGFAGTAATSSAAAGAGSGAASWASSLGPYAWAALVLYAMFGDFSKFSLGTVAEGLFDGNKLKDANLGDFVFGDNPEKTRGGALEQPLDYLGTVIENAAKTFGAELDGVALSIATDLDREGLISGIVRIVKDGLIVSGTQTGSGAFGEGKTTPVWDQDALQIVGQSIMPSEAAKKLTQQELQEWFGRQLPTVIIQALQASDLGGRFGEYFDSVSAGLLTDAKATDMLTTANAVAALTKNLAPLGGVFTQLSEMSVKATAEFANSLGGFDAVTSLVSNYVTDFYSEAERTALATSALQDVFTQFGATMPATREGFRALVDAQDLGTESGRRFFTALMDISDEFAALVPSTEAASDRIGQIAAKRFELENDILRAQGREWDVVLRLRDRELEALRKLDPELVKLQMQLWGLNDAASAAARSAEIAESFARFPGGAATSIGALNSGRGAIAEANQMQQLVNAFEKELVTVGSAWKGYVDDWWKGAIPAVTRSALFNNFAIGELGKEATRLAVDAEADARRQLGIQFSGGIADPMIEAAQKAQLDATERLIESLDSLERELADYIDSLLTGNLSALSPEERFAEAQRQYQTTLAAARAGDMASREKADDVAGTFLSIAQEFFGAASYSVVFDAVVKELQALREELAEVRKNTGQTTSATAQTGLVLADLMREGNANSAQAASTAQLAKAANVA